MERESRIGKRNTTQTHIYTATSSTSPGQAKAVKLKRSSSQAHLYGVNDGREITNNVDLYTQRRERNKGRQLDLDQRPPDRDSLAAVDLLTGLGRLVLGLLLRRKRQHWARRASSEHRAPTNQTHLRSEDVVVNLIHDRLDLVLHYVRKQLKARLSRPLIPTTT